MFTALLVACGLFGLAAFIGQLVGFASTKRSGRIAALRLLVFFVWGGLFVVLMLAFVMFHYCERNCSGELNYQSLPVVVAMVVVNAAALWAGLRGIPGMVREAAADDGSVS